MSNKDEFNLVLREWIEVFMRHSMHSFTNWMADHDLSRSQVSALMMINHRKNCQVTMIGEDLGISTPAASQLVDRLVQLDMVEREEDPDDRRVKILALSKKGRELIHEGFKARLYWTDELTESLSEKNLEDITQGFKNMVAVAEKISSLPKDCDIERTIIWKLRKNQETDK